MIVDGLNVGNKPVDKLIPLGAWPSRCTLTRPRASVITGPAGWIAESTFPTPTWPLRNDSGQSRTCNRAASIKAHYAPWGELIGKGIGVHCGEGGSYSKTPCDVFLAWMTDVLDILKGHGIGWALWNLRGSFGVVDSGRTDIEYEDFEGHRLDRRLLTLLQKS